MEGEGHSLIINIPKPRIFDKHSDHSIKIQGNKPCLKRQSERRFRKPSDLSLTKYSLPGGEPLQATAVTRDELFMPYRQYTRKQKTDCHRQRLSIHIHDKYKIISTDLRTRLQVDDPPDDIVGQTDIDEGFFKYVNGRSLPYRAPLYKSLKFFFNNLLRKRQEIGYRNDCFWNIEINHRQEQKTYDLAVQRFMDQAKYFDNFISNDYEKSMSFLDNWDELKEKVNDKNTELENTAADIFITVSRLIGLDYRHSVLQKYARFLFYLSPPKWRLQNREFARSVEIEARGFDFGRSSDDDTFSVLFEKMQKECFSDYVQPVLYFTEPSGLMEVFETIEQQQLHHFTYVTQMAPYARSLKIGMKSLKDRVALDSTLVANLIKGFESLIELYEERSNQLEGKFYKVLNGMFYKSVGTPEVLKFHMHLEFCHEKVYSEKPINPDIFTMAKSLENFYMYYAKRLDKLHSGTVQKAISQCLTEKRKSKRITEAVKELRMCARLRQKLLNSFAPPSRKVELQLDYSVPVKKRSTPKKLKTASKSLESNKDFLTDVELEYLRLFTDWNENEDPALFLQSFCAERYGEILRIT